MDNEKINIRRDNQQKLIDYYGLLTIGVLLVEIISIILGYFNIGNSIDKINMLIGNYIDLSKYIDIGSNIYSLVYIIGCTISFLFIVIYNITILALLTISNFIISKKVTKKRLLFSKALNIVSLSIILTLAILKFFSNLDTLSVVADLGLLFLAFVFLRKIAELFIYIFQAFIICKYTFSKSNGRQ